MKLSGDLVVFITGGASGLGEATVRYLHSHGCEVAIADMQVENMEKIQKDLGKDRVHIVKCDVTSEQAVKEAVESTVKAFGTVHAALACAGVAWPGLMLTSKG